MKQSQRDKNFYNNIHKCGLSDNHVEGMIRMFAKRDQFNLNDIQPFSDFYINAQGAEDIVANRFIYKTKNANLYSINTDFIKDEARRLMIENSQSLNVKKQPKKSGNEMSTNKSINCLYEDLKAVQVIFEDDGNEYTYKTFFDFEVGDLCIVDSPRNGYAVVEVVDTDSSRLEEDYLFKFVVQKIDDADYLKAVKKEKEAVRKLSSLVLKSRRETAKEEITKMLGGDMDALKKLSDSLK